MTADTPAAGAAVTATRPRFPIPGVTYRPPAEAHRWFEAGAWSPSTLGLAVRAAAQETGDRVALVAGADRLTWNDLDRRADHLAAGLLVAGLTPGDRVVVQMGTGPAVVLAFLAFAKAGLVPVCAVPTYRAYEIGALIERSGAVAHVVEPGAAGAFDLVAFAASLRAERPQLRHLLVAAEDCPSGARSLGDLEAAGAGMGAAAEQLLDAAAPAPEDVLAFQLSGGTTGVPKIIPRYHAEYLAYAGTWAERLGITGDDVMLWALSLAHNAGMILMLVPSIFQRCRLVLQARFDVQGFLTAIEAERVTVGGSIGPIGPRLLQADLSRFDLSSLRYFFTLNRSAALEAHLGVPCANMFGITEGILMGASPDAPAAVRHATLGHPTSPFDEVRILQLGRDDPVPTGETGELCFRGPSSLTAYFGDEESTTAAFTSDGFFRSGDLVRAVPAGDGFAYSFEGRAKENIDRGGEKFGVAEIEDLIADHPAVTEARVVGIPDDEMGERVCAFLVLEPNASAPTVRSLGEYLLAAGLAKFKLPERIEVLEEFPVTRVGKLDRVALCGLVADAGATSC